MLTREFERLATKEQQDDEWEVSILDFSTHSACNDSKPNSKDSAPCSTDCRPFQDLSDDDQEEDTSSFYDAVMQCSGNFFKVVTCNSSVGLYPL